MNSYNAASISEMWEISRLPPAAILLTTPSSITSPGGTSTLFAHRACPECCGEQLLRVAVTDEPQPHVVPARLRCVRNVRREGGVLWWHEEVRDWEIKCPR
jgi:hypothetical protein